MHIALEGIRGAGKSTIIEKVLPDVLMILPGTCYLPITAPMCPLHPYERIMEEIPSLKHDDQYIEQLFLKRALWHQDHLSNDSQFILGDRSIATAFVSRWNKWKDPYYTINRVKAQYKDVHKPDVIIWLKTEVINAVRNIKSRVQKVICKNDERQEALDEAEYIYEELFHGRIYHRKVQNIQIVEVKNNTSTEETSSEVLSILKFYTKS